MRFFLQRLRNLWQLSRFKITEFDNKLVITERNGELVFARPQNSNKKATIVEDDPLEDLEKYI